MNTTQLVNRALHLLVNSPIVIPANCSLCEQPLDFYNVAPGELIGFNHATCIDRERERTKHLCRRPYQLPRRVRE